MSGNASKREPAKFNWRACALRFVQISQNLVCLCNSSRPTAWMCFWTHFFSEISKKGSCLSSNNYCACALGAKIFTFCKSTTQILDDYVFGFCIVAYLNLWECKMFFQFLDTFWCISLQEMAPMLPSKDRIETCAH